MLAPQIAYIPWGHSVLIFIGNFFCLLLVVLEFFKAFSDNYVFLAPVFLPFPLPLVSQSHQRRIGNGKDFTANPQSSKMGTYIY